MIRQRYQGDFRRLSKLIRLTSRRKTTSTNMPHSQRKQSLGRHKTKMLGTGLRRKILTVFLHGVTLWHFQGRPEFVG